MASDKYQTRLKQSIINCLEKTENKAVTAKDIFCYLIESGERVNLSTVYRNIDKLVESKDLVKCSSDDGKCSTYIWAGSQNKCREHLHLQCVSCGKVIHLDCDGADEFIEHIARKHGFDIKLNNAMLYGLCNECKRNNRE